MPNFQPHDYVFRLGDIVNSYYEITKGNMAISLPIQYNGDSYPVNFISLPTGSIQGLEFVLQREHMSVYELFSLNSSSVEVLKTNTATLYSKSSEEILDLILKYKPTVEKILGANDLLDKVFTTTHKIYHSFFLSMAYLHKQYDFNLQNDDLIDIMDQLLEYARNHKIESKIFPLTNFLYSIPFTEFDDFFRNPQFMDSFYLKRMFQILPQIKDTLAKDKIFILNLLIDIAVKSEKLINGLFHKTQKTITYIENIFADNTVKMLKDFLQASEKSQDIAQYIVSVAKSSIGFLDQKVISVLKPFSSDLIDDIEDKMDTFKDSLGRYEDRLGPMSSTTQQVRQQPMPQELQGSVMQILDFSGLEQDFRTKFMEDFNKWKISSNRLAVDDEMSKMRKRVGDHFWNIYTACFKKHKMEGVPLIKPVELMFKYGFFDESLLSGTFAKALLEKSVEQYKEDDLKIYNVYDWLIAVCDEVYTPSNSKTGELVDVTLRDMSKEEEQKTGKRPDPQSFNTLEFRIEYEIDNLVKESSKICNGSFSTYVPILLEEQVPLLDFKQQYLTVEKLKKTFTELKKLDFSAFYREVRFKTETVEEFIQKEVLPFFILMPGIGSKSIVWQPKERLKETSARIAFPFLSLTSPAQSMMYTFGFYRWEIVKDILGPSWNDVSLLSLTSEYSDYEATYKNHKDLDEEIREKIAQEFKKFRTTRDRFINDYTKWMTVDAQGRPGVNKVVRELFYRHIPFPKDVRAKLGTTPAYEQLNDRYIILLKKELSRLKLKFQKYQNTDGSLPSDLEAYLQFLVK